MLPFNRPDLAQPSERRQEDGLKLPVGLTSAETPSLVHDSSQGRHSKCLFRKDVLVAYHVRSLFQTLGCLGGVEGSRMCGACLLSLHPPHSVGVPLWTQPWRRERPTCHLEAASTLEMNKRGDGGVPPSQPQI